MKTKNKGSTMLPSFFIAIVATYIMKTQQRTLPFLIIATLFFYIHMDTKNN